MAITRLSVSSISNGFPKFQRAWDQSTLIGQDVVDIFGDSSGLALWRLEGNANDSGGNYNGTTSGVTYSTTRKERTGNFSGIFLPNSGSTISIPSVRNSYPLSVSLWAQNDFGWNNVNQAQYEIFNMSIAGNRLSLGWTYEGSWTPQKGLTVMYGNSNHWSGKPSNDFNYDSTSFFHIVYCVPSYNGTPVVYVNGTSITMNNNGGGHGGSPGWNIGSNSTSGEYWTGKLDQIRFFNKVLTQSEVNTLYNGGLGI